MAFNLNNLTATLANMDNKEQVSSNYLQFIQKKGFFLSKDNAEAVGFKPDSEWKKVEHSFSSADEATEGYLNKSPNLLICKKSELTMFDKDGKVLGAYDKAVYHKGVHSLRMRFVVIIVDAKGNPLVEEPLMLPLKGAFQVSFSTALQSHRVQCKKLLKTMTKINYSVDSEVFSYFIFKPTFHNVESGYKTTVSKINSYLEVTPDNIQQMLLMENPGIADLVKAALKMEVGYTTSAPAAPPVLKKDSDIVPLQQEQKNSLNSFVEQFAGDEAPEEEEAVALF